MKSALTICILFLFVLIIHPTHAAIDRIQKEDGARLAVGLMRLYYHIGKSTASFVKTVFCSIDDFPRAVAADIFHVGRPQAPEGYYPSPEATDEQAASVETVETHERDTAHE